MDRKHTPANLKEAETLVSCLFGIPVENLHSFIIIIDCECERDIADCRELPEHCHTRLTSSLNKFDNEDYGDILRLMSRMQEMLIRK